MTALPSLWIVLSSNVKYPLFFFLVHCILNAILLYMNVAILAFYFLAFAWKMPLFSFLFQTCLLQITCSWGLFLCFILLCFRPAWESLLFNKGTQSIQIAMTIDYYTPFCPITLLFIFCNSFILTEYL